MGDEYILALQRAIESEYEVITFLHNTNAEHVAKKILLEGFEFQSHLDYTTDVVSAKDVVTLKYFTIVRQAYGNFTLIIQISKEIIESYSQKLKNKDHHFSEVLSVKPSYLGSEDDLIYCLAPHFIKGYINACTHDFYVNPNFDPLLRIPVFEENLRNILNQR